jgi:hypothetical protein
MTIYEPNDEVRPTGREPAEFIDPQEPDEDVSEEGDDPSARPTGSAPLPKK